MTPHAREGTPRLLACMHARRPAAQGSLDPYTPHIAVPAHVEHHEKPGEDLPYYFVSIDEAGGMGSAGEQVPTAPAC